MDKYLLPQKEANKTQVTMFMFSGLTDNRNISIFLFLFFLNVYIVSVVGNLGIMVMVHKSSNLHTPMYFFLSYLSLVDLLYSSIITPKMLSDLTSTRKTISFEGCAVQFFFFAAMADTEVLLLSNMSYDRYAAICYPLHYVFMMTKKKCFCLATLAFSIGFVQSALQTNCIFSLHFCGSNIIDHFYCDVPPLLKLSCSDYSLCEKISVSFIGSCSIGSLATIVISYIFIISSILNIKSTKGREKAFNTCSSHLMCASIFYLSVFFTYLHPHSLDFEKHDKVAAVFYSVMTPMLNPLIYSLRNQEVKGVIVQIAHNVSVANFISLFITRTFGKLQTKINV